MGVFHVLSGAVYSFGFFVFIDGAVFAKNSGQPYDFGDSTTCWLCFIGIILIAMCDIRKLSGNGSEDDYANFGGGGMAGDDDECAPIKARILFFFGACFFLAAMTAAVWSLAGPRSGSWPSWAMLTQTFIQMLAALFLGIGQVQASKPRDTGF